MSEIKCDECPEVRTTARGFLIHKWNEHSKPREHKHQFVIPVEWKYFVDRDGKLVYQKHGPYDVKKVTKLRCECSEETER